jgi:hypothetical protein
VTGGRLRKMTRAAQLEVARKRKRVLVVDDSITVREVERKLLENNGYQVEVAVDGMDGWNAVRSGAYDLIITDVDMPRMNGIELVQSIKADPQLQALPVMIRLLQGPGGRPAAGVGGGGQLLPDKEQLPRRDPGQCGRRSDWDGLKDRQRPRLGRRRTPPSMPRGLSPAMPGCGP